VPGVSAEAVRMIVNSITLVHNSPKSRKSSDFSKSPNFKIEARPDAHGYFGVNYWLKPRRFHSPLITPSGTTRNPAEPSTPSSHLKA
jgi:hypothetical protein